jgi:transcriptional regulator with PAS, ATPase and Fis domain
VDKERAESVTVPELAQGESGGQSTAVLILLGDGRPGALVGRVVSLPPKLSVGRGPERLDPSEGVLTMPDPLLSRVHMTVERRPNGTYRIEDAQSTNGTLVDGRRIDGAHNLSDGSLVFFGAHAAVYRHASSSELSALEEERANPFGPLATLSRGLAEALGRLRRLVKAGDETLLLGESGVGKEVYARAIHRASGRAGRFVGLSCAAIPGELAESELFGYVRGAHSTATESKVGFLEAAAGGTLFLDEIGDMPPRLQGKLLRALQEREVIPLGSTAPRRIDVCIVAATSRFAEGHGDGLLRPDLAARLGSEPFEIPPLRHRVEDMASLVPHFLAGSPARAFDPAAWRALCLYQWPGNVRELEKALRRASALASGEQIRLADLPRAVREVFDRPASATHPGWANKVPSRVELDDLLRSHHGNVAQVARILDRRWNVVWRWITKHELEPDRYRS